MLFPGLPTSKTDTRVLVQIYREHGFIFPAAFRPEAAAARLLCEVGRWFGAELFLLNCRFLRHEVMCAK